MGSIEALVHRSEEHTSELQSLAYLVCRLLLEKKKNQRATGAIAVKQNTRSTTSSIDGGTRRYRDTRHNTASCCVPPLAVYSLRSFFLNDTPTTEISPLSLPDALPI